MSAHWRTQQIEDSEESSMEYDAPKVKAIHKPKPRDTLKKDSSVKIEVSNKSASNDLDVYYR